MYPYLKQENETDFALFSRLCTLEGCQMLIFDGKLLAYSEQYIEQQAVAGTLEVDENVQQACGSVAGQQSLGELARVPVFIGVSQQPLGEAGRSNTLSSRPSLARWRWTKTGTLPTKTTGARASDPAK